MGFFDGSRNVDPSGGGTRFRAGKYPAIKIVKCSVNQGHWGTRFVMEGVVVAEPVATEPGVVPNPLGSTGSFTCEITGQWGKYGIADAKSCLGAAKGWDLDGIRERGEIMERFMNEAVEPGNPAAGLLVATEARTHVRTGKPDMTKHRWYPVGRLPGLEGVMPTLDGAAMKVTSTEEPSPAAASAFGNAAPAAPPPPPAAPPPPSQEIKAEWYDFAPPDPRAGREQYNAQGHVRPKP